MSHSKFFVLLVLALVAASSIELQDLVRDSFADDPNAFNRLMKPPNERNPPPVRDGIHDPQSAAIDLLQTPETAFAPLPDGSSGNYVDWVQALEQSKIKPRNDRVDPAVEPTVMDLNIVREVKGSMPDVLYPHKQHTQWLDCSNCHPAIFIPQKGANAMSMASILLGEGCGTCHGKVAFPVSACRRCHSQSTKPVGSETAASGSSAGSN